MRLVEFPTLLGNKVFSVNPETVAAISPRYEGLEDHQNGTEIMLASGQSDDGGVVFVTSVEYAQVKKKLTNKRN